MQSQVGQTELWVLRHASTPWNEERRYQGRTDVPLSLRGRDEAATWQLPLAGKPDLVVASPLARAQQTANLLFPDLPVRIEPRLVELSMGEWEGKKIDEVTKSSINLEENDGWRGLNFSPPGGESLRDAMARTSGWLKELGGEGHRRVTAITHKGTIHALYALATGWDARAKPRPRPRFPRLHRFTLSASGEISLLELNVPLGNEKMLQRTAKSYAVGL